MKKREAILIIVVLALVCWNVSYRFYYQAEFNRRVEALQAEGFPISLDDIEANYVLPEGVENAADIYLKAFSKFQKPTQSEKETLPYFQNNHIAYTNYYDLSQDTVEVMLSFLEKNQRALDLLDDASQVKHCLWPRSKDKIWFSNDHLTEIIDCAKLLQIRNVYSAEKGQTELIFESLKSSISLSKTLKRQAFLIDHLVGMSLRHYIIESLNKTLNRISFEEQQLSYIQNEHKSLQSLDDLYRALVADRVCTLEFWQLPYSEQGKDGFPPPPPTVKWLNSVSGLIKKDQLLSLDHLEEYLMASKLPTHKRSIAFQKVDQKKYDLSFLHAHLKNSNGFAPIANIDLRVLGSLRCAETALAIERYRLKYGSVPDGLEQLVPEFMEELPREPFDNEVLRYIKHDVGYTVYTIGEDGIDNGGLSKEQMIEKTGEDDPEEYDWPFTVRR